MTGLAGRVRLWAVVIVLRGRVARLGTVVTPHLAFSSTHAFGHGRAPLGTLFPHDLTALPPLHPFFFSQTMEMRAEAAERKIVDLEQQLEAAQDALEAAKEETLAAKAANDVRVF